ncbi:hypothetical protein ACFV42_23340 [Streptomyces solisilvae]|uniref:hypothetical protein n=1 Tax=Streptomyces malaysiensis TaxID=92644 RepID=UPI0036C05F4C
MTSHTEIALHNYLGSRRELLKAMLADRRGGMSANDIAETAASAWSRPITLDYLNCWELREDAKAALRQAGLADYVGVRTTGDMKGPRRVLLHIACDPVDLDDPQTWHSLPGRIDAALTAAQISWSLPESPQNTTLDALLEDIEEAQLQRI